MTDETITRVPKPGQVNLVGLTKTDYRGAPSTLCQGCGHNSIASQIIAVPTALYAQAAGIIRSPPRSWPPATS